MNQNIDKITDLIHYILENRKGKYEFSEISDYDVLSEQGVLKIVEKDLQYLEINLDSILFNEVLLNIAETELKRKLPDNIADALLFIDDFENHLKNKYQLDILSKEYTNSINALKAFVLTILNNRLSVYDFYFELVNDKMQNRKDRSDIIDLYFQFLIISNSSEEIILRSCKEYNNNEKHPTNYTHKFLRRLGETNNNLALQIYLYIIENELVSYYGFIPNLLIGLYNSGYKEAFDDTKKLLKKDNIIAMKSFSGL